MRGNAPSDNLIDARGLRGESTSEDVLLEDAFCEMQERESCALVRWVWLWFIGF
jgi:hypothetical protein